MKRCLHKKTVCLDVKSIPYFELRNESSLKNIGQPARTLEEKRAGSAAKLWGERSPGLQSRGKALQLGEGPRDDLFLPLGRFQDGAVQLLSVGKRLLP